MVDGELDFAAIEAMPAAEAVAALCRIKGIGPWTAEIYLMFCAGHPDIFPAGDLALQKAVGHALELGDRVAVHGPHRLWQKRWAPHRHAAALLFWRYYARDEEPRRDCPVTPRLSGPMLPPRSGGAPKQAVVLLHGYGSDGTDLIGARADVGAELSRCAVRLAQRARGLRGQSRRLSVVCARSRPRSL